MSIFIFLKNAFEFFLLLSQGTTIPKIRISGQKMLAKTKRKKRPKKSNGPYKKLGFQGRKCGQGDIV